MKRKQEPDNNPPFETDSDRVFELDEVNFNEEDELTFVDLSPEAELETAQEGEETVGDTVDNAGTLDDLTPENLIPNDGSRSPFEPGGLTPNDESLSVVHEGEIGEGYGLDEAELAIVDPLDGKPEKAGKPEKTGELKNAEDAKGIRKKHQ